MQYMPCIPSARVITGLIISRGHMQCPVASSNDANKLMNMLWAIITFTQNIEVWIHIANAAKLHLPRVAVDYVKKIIYPDF